MRGGERENTRMASAPPAAIASMAGPVITRRGNKGLIRPVQEGNGVSLQSESHSPR